MHLLRSCRLASSEAPSLPKFKWGQSKEKVFLTISVRDLKQGSERVEFEEDRVRFSASDAQGKAYGLDLELRQDVDPAACAWEPLQRPDRHGKSVLVTLAKRFPSAWDSLVVDASLYRKVMERDWAREDETLGSPVDDQYFAEHSEYLPQVTMDKLEKMREGVEALVLSVRHAACGQCKVVDDTFAAAAKTLSKAKKGSRLPLRLALVDPRRERLLARRLGARCAPRPQECRHYVLGPVGGAGGDEAVGIRGRHQEAALERELKKAARRQFAPLTAEAARSGRGGATVALAVLAPGAPPHVIRAAHRSRLWLDVAVAASEEDAWDLGLGSGSLASRVLVWPPGETDPVPISGETDPELLERRLQVRALAPLADMVSFEDEEPYEEIGLPVARLFLNGSSADAGARAVVRDLARRLAGRVSFVARNASQKAHDWRSHGLPGDYFPAFALGMSTAWNASKYAFLEPAGADFWADGARAGAALAAFVEEALGGALEPSPMSQPPPSEEAPLGAVRTLVGRTCRSLVEESETDALVEGYDQWRRDHPWRTRQVDVLAPLLARLNISLYRFDFGYNECPKGGLPTISAGYSGYFWIPRRAKDRKKSWQKLKKLDPPMDRVMSFVRKHSAAKVDAEAIVLELNATVRDMERRESAQAWQAKWGTTVAAATTLAAGAAGLLWLRRARRRPPAATAEGAEGTGGAAPAAGGGPAAGAAASVAE